MVGQREDKNSCKAMRFENGVGHELFAVLKDKTRKKYRRGNWGREKGEGEKRKKSTRNVDSLRLFRFSSNMLLILWCYGL
jgi:hypothetical protein